MNDLPSSERAAAIQHELLAQSLSGNVSEESEIPTAATVVLVRDSDAGVEVLMLLRPDKQSFGGAWVFPGGRTEDQDEQGAVDELSIARRAGARETWEEVGLTLDADDLVELSLWVPPLHLPKRIRTWFFVAEAPDEALTLSAREVVQAQWIRPVDMLALHEAGSAVLYPPTYVTLAELGIAQTARELVDRIAAAPLEKHESRTIPAEDGMFFLWGNDSGADDVPAAQRHRLLVSPTTWRYERGTA